MEQMLKQTFEAREIDIGYHPEGYVIDKTASAMNRYTRWKIAADGKWTDPKPVCFNSMPQESWLKADGFNWGATGRIASA